MKIVSIANFKGGTGKTATAVNLAAIFARDGARVLLIDADAQHNASDFYLKPMDREGAATLTDVLEGTAELLWTDNVTPSGREGLDLLPSDMGLLRLDLAAIMTGAAGCQRRMMDFLDVIRQDEAYDWILIDCPPSFTAASVSVLINSDLVLLPTRLDAFSRQGVHELIDQLNSAGRYFAAPEYRVLITMADKPNLSRQGKELLRAGRIAVCSTVIRACVSVGESSYSRQPLYEYAPKSNPARDYEALAAELRGAEAMDCRANAAAQARNDIGEV